MRSMSYYALEDVLPCVRVISVMSAAPLILHYHYVHTAKTMWVAGYTHYCRFVFCIPRLYNMQPCIFLLYFFLDSFFLSLQESDRHGTLGHLLVF